MSLNQGRIEITTTFINPVVGTQYTAIGRSDYKGKKYKFSQFDMECNLFQNPANKFTGNIYIRVDTPKRCKIFKVHKVVRGVANVTDKKQNSK